MHGKYRTQEEREHGKCIKGTIPAVIEIYAWMHEVCSFMVQSINKNFEILWV